MITSLTADSTPTELIEQLNELDEWISISQAEAGMGAISMGFDPYDGMVGVPARTAESLAWEAEARARVDAHLAANPRVPFVATPADPTDLPF